MPIEKITIETLARTYSRKSGYSEPAITFDSLCAALTETYAQANEIGWETKALESFTAWVLKARTGANKAA